MLKTLHIRNYALIEELSIDFPEGFNIITGETGAGKSIILGALGLILGERADPGILRDRDRKCIVEGVFRVSGLDDCFRELELDTDELTILRREITTSGKSRAFVNDTPVTLKILQDIAFRLIDIHSQHQNLEAGSRSFQLNLIDLVADNAASLAGYQQVYRSLLRERSGLELLREKAAKAGSELDYQRFQLKQLDDARLKENEQAELEAERKVLEHAEEIKLTLGGLSDTLNGEETAVLSRLKDQLARLSRLTALIPEAGLIRQRLESCYLELKDMGEESASLAERTALDPDRMRIVNERLDLLYTLQQKFRAGSVEELIGLRSRLEEKIGEADSYEELIGRQAQRVEELEREVAGKAAALSVRRKAVAAAVSRSVIDVLQKLGMEHACMEVTFEPASEPGPNGVDSVRFLFSANRNTEPQELSRIASGGELSRVMLAMKTLVTGSTALPTIIFDEIDTGISGEVAIRMGLILRDMARHMQVVHITHLPQIAAKGSHHFKVYKEETPEGTFTSIRKLAPDERVVELASMLGGEKVSGTARETAVQLMKD